MVDGSSQPGYGHPWSFISLRVVSSFPSSTVCRAQRLHHTSRSPYSVVSHQPRAFFRLDADSSSIGCLRRVGGIHCALCRLSTLQLARIRETATASVALLGRAVFLPRFTI